MIAFIILLVIIVFAFYFFIKRNRIKLPGEDGSVTVNKELLDQHVSFYSKLDETGKKQFEDAVQYFLEHTVITGVDTQVEELDRLLIASAGVIPIFHFKKWRYYNLREVLLYSDAINM